jgi:rod shape-determining protein MreD
MTPIEESPIDFSPFRPALPAGRARVLPWATVVAGSLVTIVPVIASLPLLPPIGLIMLLTWRLLARFSLRPWAGAPLGLFDDIVSGQPLGASMLSWSLVMIAIELVEQRLIFRDFWQDWLIAGGGIVFCVMLGRFVAVPLGAHVDVMLVAQIVMAIALFPLAARLVAWIDRKRGVPE